jgi:catechol 2,3-dioxygenase-like lactoylglutathione lyase family enzyme
VAVEQRRGQMTMFAEARVEAVVPTTSLKRARSFYEDRVGLEPDESHDANSEVAYPVGDGSRIVVYELGEVLAPAHTVAHLVVADVEAAVAELRGRGVPFEEYDLPTLRTVDGIATVGASKFAWFKDPDLNVIAIHD